MSCFNLSKQIASPFLRRLPPRNGDSSAPFSRIEKATFFASHASSGAIPDPRWRFVGVSPEGSEVTLYLPLTLKGFQIVQLQNLQALWALRKRSTLTEGGTPTGQ
jgi:hypothetical protein